jgi:hypothetical protein
MRQLIAILALSLLSACTTANTRQHSETMPRPPAGAKILVVQPDISLALLTATGAREPRADWSKQGQDNLAAQISAALSARGHAAQGFDPAGSMDGRVGQILRLHQAVGESILFTSYGPVPLPTKKDKFDWTLGEGVQELGVQTGAQYALFTFGGGTYASGGRAAMAVLGAVAGLAVPLGNQQIFASLVDLRTGRILWSNVTTASSGSDMRETEGARVLVEALMKDAPL